MSDQEHKETNENKGIKKDESENGIGTCDPDSTFTDEQRRKLQEELDELKSNSSDNFSTSSRCVIS